LIAAPMAALLFLEILKVKFAFHQEQLQKAGAIIRKIFPN